MNTLFQMFGFHAPGFMDSFWPSFWSTIAAGSIVGGLITWLISRINRPALEVSLEVGTSVQRRYTLRFSVINKGRIQFRENEIFWHIYIDPALVPVGKTYNECGVGLDSKPYRYFKGILALPCFQESSATFFEIPVVAKDVAVLDLNYYYSLSTAHGFFPKESFAKRIFARIRVAPGTNVFVRQPIGKIVLKSI